MELSLELIGVTACLGFFGFGILAGYIIWGVDTYVCDTDPDEEQED